MGAKQARLCRHPNLSKLKRNKLIVFLFDSDWKGAISRCTDSKSGSKEARTWSTSPGFFDGDLAADVLPLHVACSLHAPLAVVDALAIAYPPGVEIVETSFKRLPLHIACQYSADADVIELLLHLYPAGSIVPDGLDRLPLHYACSNGTVFEVVKALLYANPDSATHADYKGWNALHVACYFGAPTMVVKEILTACPDSVRGVTRKGSDALKLARKVTWKNKEDVVRLLEEALGIGKVDVDDVDTNDVMMGELELEEPINMLGMEEPIDMLGMEGVQVLRCSNDVGRRPSIDPP